MKEDLGDLYMDEADKLGGSLSLDESAEDEEVTVEKERDVELSLGADYTQQGGLGASVRLNIKL